MDGVGRRHIYEYAIQIMMWASKRYLYLHRFTVGNLRNSPLDEELV
jgi:hypothetical protein